MTCISWCLLWKVKFFIPYHWSVSFNLELILKASIRNNWGMSMIHCLKLNCLPFYFSWINTWNKDHTPHQRRSDRIHWRKTYQGRSQETQSVYWLSNQIVGREGTWQGSIRWWRRRGREKGRRWRGKGINRDIYIHNKKHLKLNHYRKDSNKLRTVACE